MEETPGTDTPEGKEQGLADAIHGRREDIFHLGFVTETSSWGSDREPGVELRPPRKI